MGRITRLQGSVCTGSGIVEWNHRTVKVNTARKHCSIAEAVHLYNVTPCDGTTVIKAPGNGVYRYEVQDCVWSAQEQHTLDTTPGNDEGEEYTTGDIVWVRQRGERCT